MLGDIFKDDRNFTFSYYKKLGENHRMFCMEQESVVDFTDDGFRKLKLYRPYVDIVENKDTVVLGGISYVDYMSQVKSLDEDVYKQLKEFVDPFEFRSKLETILESSKEDFEKSRVLYTGMWIKENLNTLVEMKSKELDKLTIAQETLDSTDNVSVQESLIQEIKESKERLKLISKAFCFI